MTGGAFSFTVIDPDGSTSTDARGVNDLGQIVGDYVACHPACSGPHGFFFDGATSTSFDVPGGFGSSTLAFGISGNGQIVGAFQDATGQHGFLKDGTTFTTIDAPGAILTQAAGIASSGQIVGSFGDVPGGRNIHGFLFDGATFTNIDVPGARMGAFTLAFGINDCAEIVGWYADGDLVEHGFLFDGASFATFDVPGAKREGYRGIRDR